MALVDIAHKAEDLVYRNLEKHKAKKGWQPSIRAYLGYGDEKKVRVLGRVLLRDPNDPNAHRAGPEDNYPTNGTIRRQAQRGFRQFLTLQIPDHPVSVTAGDQTVHTRTNADGYLDVQVRHHGLAPGWQDVTISAAGAEPVTTQVFIVKPGTRIGFVCDVDDTTIVTRLPRPLIAAYNSWFQRTNARQPVPGMARFINELTRRHPDAPFIYLSTGAWNTFESLVRFFRDHGFPTGPLILSDWGPTQTNLFRSGQEHKRVQLRNLVIDFPEIQWFLIGDNGQHDPVIYGGFAADHPDHVAGIAIRQLSSEEHVLAHGTTAPIENSARANTDDIPYVMGKDGDELRACYAQNRVKGQNVCLARRVAGVRFGLFECRLSGCSRCR